MGDWSRRRVLIGAAGAAVWPVRAGAADRPARVGVLTARCPAAIVVGGQLLAGAPSRRRPAVRRGSSDGCPTPGADPARERHSTVGSVGRRSATAPIGDVQGPKDRRHVMLHRRLGEVEDATDPFVAPPFDQQRRHFGPTRGETEIGQRAGRRRRDRFAPRQRLRRHMETAGEHEADGIDHDRARGRLRDEADGPEVERAGSLRDRSPPTGSRRAAPVDRGADGRKAAVRRNPATRGRSSRGGDRRRPPLVATRRRRHSPPARRAPDTSSSKTPISAVRMRWRSSTRRIFMRPRRSVSRDASIRRSPPQHKDAETAVGGRR